MPNFLFCPLRKTWVADLPEERVRQALIQELTLHLGYSLGNLLVEKSLNQLPHLQSKATLASLSNRRADLIIFAKEIHSEYPLYPLLLIECKAVPLTNKVFRQIIGYNQFVGAYFIAVVNQTHRYLGFYQPNCKDFTFQEGLPSYDSLFKLAQANKL